MPAMKRSLAAAGAALLLALSAPLSAAAAPDPYTPPSPDPWATTIVSCSHLTRQFSANSFDGNAALTLTVSGAYAAPTFATFAAAQVTKQLTSASDGSASISLDFGAGAQGVYNVDLVEPGTANAAYGVVTVTSACGAVDPTQKSASSLARTGTSIDFGVLWGAGAAVVAGIVFWVISRVRRGSRFHRS